MFKTVKIFCLEIENSEIVSNSLIIFIITGINMENSFSQFDYLTWIDSSTSIFPVVSQWKSLQQETLIALIYKKNISKKTKIELVQMQTFRNLNQEEIFTLTLQIFHQIWYSSCFLVSHKAEASCSSSKTLGFYRQTVIFILSSANFSQWRI